MAAPDRCSFKRLPDDLVRRILLDYVGEELISKEKSGLYLHLMLVCKMFHTVFNHSSFRKRMMQSAAFTHGEKLDVLEEELEYLGEDEFPERRNMKTYEEIFRGANPAVNSCIDAHMLLVTIELVSNPQILYRNLLLHLKFKNEGVLLEQENLSVFAQETLKVSPKQFIKNYQRLVILKNPTFTGLKGECLSLHQTGGPLFEANENELDESERCERCERQWDFGIAVVSFRLCYLSLQLWDMQGNYCIFDIREWKQRVVIFKPIVKR